MKRVICAMVSCFVFFNTCLIANAQVLDVLKDGDPTLKTVCTEVKEFDQDIRDKVINAQETLEQLEGAGLAANQVGYTERFFVIFSTAEGEIEYYDGTQRLNNDKPLVFINPRILETQGEQTVWEGCFSLEGFIYKLNRPMSVVVEAFDEYGRPFRFTTQGFGAKLICHEYDHLDGILCKDKAIDVKPYPDN